MSNTSRIKSGYGVIQRAVMTMEISQQAKLVYCLLVSYAGAAGECYPSFSTICDNLSMGRSTVNKAIKELYISGLIDIESRQAENGSKMSNLYYPLMVNSNSVTKNKTDEGSTQPVLGVVPNEDYPSTQPVLPLVLHGYSKNNIIKNNNEEERTHTKNSISEPSEKYSNPVKSDLEKKEKSSGKKEKKEVAIVEEKIACGDLVKNVFLTKSELEHFRRRAEKEKLPDKIVKMAIDNLSRYIQGNEGYMKKRTYAGAIAGWCWKQAKEDLLKELKFTNEYSKSNSQEPEWKRIARDRQGQTS